MFSGYCHGCAETAEKRVPPDNAHQHRKIAIDVPRKVLAIKLKEKAHRIVVMISSATMENF